MPNLAKIVFACSVLSGSLGANANREGASSQSFVPAPTQQTETSEAMTLDQKMAQSKKKSEDLNHYRELLKANMNKRLLHRASRN